jgi:hypothetical protein
VAPLQPDPCSRLPASGGSQSGCRGPSAWQVRPPPGHFSIKLRGPQDHPCATFLLYRSWTPNCIDAERTTYRSLTKSVQKEQVFVVVVFDRSIKLKDPPPAPPFQIGRRDYAKQFRRARRNHFARSLSNLKGGYGGSDVEMGPNFGGGIGGRARSF